MMKRYILAVTAFVGLALNSRAQRDITSEYITNATLENGTTGWTINNFNAPQQGNNTVGYASEAYAGWDNLTVTSYSMTQNITLPRGSYRLVNYSFFRYGLRYNTDASKSLAYLKAGSQQVPIKTLGSISGIPTDGDNGGYANSQAEGANCFDSKMYRNVVEFSVDADNTTVEIGLVGTFDLKQSWCIAGMFELFDLDDEASVSSPTDVTYAITNPGFEYRNLTGWTANGIVYQDNSWGNKAGKGFAEKWQGNAGLPDASLTQTLTGLPNGLYELSAYAHNINQRNGDAPCTGMFLTANDKEQEVGAYGQYKLRATVTDGNLTVGMKLDGCTGNWIAFDRFQLLFYGDPDAALRDLLTAYISEAEGLLAGQDGSLLSTTQKAVLQQAIDEAKAATTDNLSTCVDALSEAIRTARQQIEQVKANRTAMIAALERFENDYNLTDGNDYSRVTMSADAWTTLIAKVNAVSTALDDVSQASAYGTIKDALVSQMDATDQSLRLFKSYKAMSDGTCSVVSGITADNAEMDSDASEQEAIIALNTAFDAYAATQPDNFDVSAFLGENLDFSAAAGATLNDENSNTIKAVTGWEVNYADADTWAVIQTDQNDNAGKLYMRKNWGSSATTLEVFKEKMLPVGKYQLSFSWNSSLANMTNLSAFTVGTTKTTIGEATTETKTLTYAFEVTGQPQPFDLTFGFQKTGTGNAPAQIIVDDVTLTYTPTIVELSDAADNGQTIADNADTRAVVKLTGRTLFKDGSWNTLCLPFPLVLEGSPLEGATLMELDTESTVNGHKTGIEGQTLYLNFKSASSIVAHVPYIIKWDNDSNGDLTDPSFPGVTITDDTPTPVTATGITFQGTYAPITYDTENKSVLLMGSGNNLYYPNGNAASSINAFRAYFQLANGITAGTPSNSGTTGLTRFVLNFGDGETQSVHLSPLTPNPSRELFYDLQGRCLSDRPVRSGIYVSNGQKVVIK